MAVCELTGEALPEKNARFCGYECRVKGSFRCKHKRPTFIEGTNCYLLRTQFDKNKIDTILGINKAQLIVEGEK